MKNEKLILICPILKKDITVGNFFSYDDDVFIARSFMFLSLLAILWTNQMMVVFKKIIGTEENMDVM